MPKENFDKVDKLVARARVNPAIRKDVVRGLRSMLKTFEGYLEKLESYLETYKGKLAPNEDEQIWLEARETLRNERRRVLAIVAQTKKRLKMVRTAKRPIE